MLAASAAASGVYSQHDYNTNYNTSAVMVAVSDGLAPSGPGWLLADHYNTGAVMVDVSDDTSREHGVRRRETGSSTSDIFFHRSDLRVELLDSPPTLPNLHNRLKLDKVTGPPPSAGDHNLSSRASGSLWCLTACAAVSGVCSQHDRNASAVMVAVSDGLAPSGPGWLLADPERNTSAMNNTSAVMVDLSYGFPPAPSATTIPARCWWMCLMASPPCWWPQAQPCSTRRDSGCS